MMRWMICFAVLSASTGIAVFSKVVPIASPLSGLCLAVCALSATLLIGSVEAYETRPARIERDEA